MLLLVIPSGKLNLQEEYTYRKRAENSGRLVYRWFVHTAFLSRTFRDCVTNMRVFLYQCSLDLSNEMHQTIISERMEAKSQTLNKGSAQFPSYWFVLSHFTVPYFGSL